MQGSTKPGGHRLVDHSSSRIGLALPAISPPRPPCVRRPIEPDSPVVEPDEVVLPVLDAGLRRRRQWDQLLMRAAASCTTRSIRFAWLALCTTPPAAACQAKPTAWRAM